MNSISHNSEYSYNRVNNKRIFALDAGYLSQRPEYWPVRQSDIYTTPRSNKKLFPVISNITTPQLDHFQQLKSALDSLGENKGKDKTQLQ